MKIVVQQANKQQTLDILIVNKNAWYQTYFQNKATKTLLLTNFKKNMIGLSFYKNNGFYVEKEFPKGTWHNNSVDEICYLKI